MTASTATDDPNTMTGNLYSDRNLLDKYFVQPMQYSYEYSGRSEQVANRARQSAALYGERGAVYQQRESGAIYNLYAGRTIQKDILKNAEIDGCLRKVRNCEHRQGQPFKGLKRCRKANQVKKRKPQRCQLSPLCSEGKMSVFSYEWKKLMVMQRGLLYILAALLVSTVWLAAADIQNIETNSQSIPSAHAPAHLSAADRRTY